MNIINFDKYKLIKMPDEHIITNGMDTTIIFQNGSVKENDRIIGIDEEQWIMSDVDKSTIMKLIRWYNIKPDTPELEKVFSDMFITKSDIEEYLKGRE